MKTKVYLLIGAMLVLLASSCDIENRKECHVALAAASQAMESNPTEAQRLLQAVRGDVVSSSDHAYFVLVQARVAGMNGTNIAPLEEAVAEAMGYFVAQNDAPKAAFACYVMAKVYDAKGNSAKELYYYLSADDWASKADNQIPDFLYSSIPYNIAYIFSKNGMYDESFRYIEQALSYMEVEHCSYIRKLYVLELKALNYQLIQQPDKAFNYFDEALSIAKQHNDVASINRILYNNYRLVYNTKDYVLAEKKCSELIPAFIQSNDSTHLGLAYVTLANIYAKTNRIDSASVSIYRANKLLTRTESDMRLFLYETLTFVEQKKGNHAAAGKYQRQYNEYKLQLEAKREAEEAELAILAKEKLWQGKRLGSFFTTIVEVRADAGEQRKQLALLYAMQLTLGMCFFGLYGLYRLRKNRPTADGVVAAFCKEELLRYADRQDSLQQVFRSTKLCRDNEQVGRIGYMVDELIPPEDWNWLRMSPSIRCSYAELLCKLRNDLPQLDERELRLCMLRYAHHLTTHELRSILLMEPEEVALVKKSVRRKTKAAGYTARRLKKHIQKYVQ